MLCLSSVEQLHSCAPLNLTIVNIAGTQLKAEGLKEEALQKYEEAVKVCPTYADGFYDLGVYYSEAQQVSCTRQCRPIPAMYP